MLWDEIARFFSVLGLFFCPQGCLCYRSSSLPLLPLRHSLSYRQIRPPDGAIIFTWHCLDEVLENFGHASWYPTPASFWSTGVPCPQRRHLQLKYWCSVSATSSWFVWKMLGWFMCSPWKGGTILFKQQSAQNSERTRKFSACFYRCLQHALQDKLFPRFCYLF